MKRIKLKIKLPAALSLLNNSGSMFQVYPVKTNAKTREVALAQGNYKRQLPVPES
jgi:hypothetical protein